MNKKLQDKNKIDIKGNLNNVTINNIYNTNEKKTSRKWTRKISLAFIITVSMGVYAEPAFKMIINVFIN